MVFHHFVRNLRNFSSNFIQKNSNNQKVCDIVYVLVCSKHEQHVDDTNQQVIYTSY
jgi:hypothetical protein